MKRCNWLHHVPNRLTCIESPKLTQPTLHTMCNLFFSCCTLLRHSYVPQKFLRALKDRLVLKIRVAGDRVVYRQRKLPVAGRKGQPWGGHHGGGGSCPDSLSACAISHFKIILNKLHHKKMVGRWLADHLQCTNHLPTNHQPTTYWLPTCTDHQPTTYRPPTDRLPTTYLPLLYSTVLV